MELNVSIKPRVVVVVSRITVVSEPVASVAVTALTDELLVIGPTIDKETFEDTTMVEEADNVVGSDGTTVG